MPIRIEDILDLRSYNSSPRYPQQQQPPHHRQLWSSRGFKWTLLAIVIIYSVQFGIVVSRVDTSLKESRLDSFLGVNNNSKHNSNKRSQSRAHKEPQKHQGPQKQQQQQQQQEQESQKQQKQRQQKEQPQAQRKRPQRQQELPVPQREQKKKQKLVSAQQLLRPDDHQNTNTSLAQLFNNHQEISKPRQELAVTTPNTTTRSQQYDPLHKVEEKPQGVQPKSEEKTAQQLQPKVNLPKIEDQSDKVPEGPSAFKTADSKTTTKATETGLHVIPPTSTNNTLPSQQEHDLVHQYFQQTWNRSFLPLSAVLEENDPYILDAKPLPLRVSPKLTTVSYPDHIRSCQDIPNNWPVGHSKEMDHLYGTNVGHLETPFKHRLEYAQTTCPVDADPFLPWIHDVFVTASGHVQFIAHNRRRCNRDPWHFKADIENLEPQVALLQSIPIQTVHLDQNHSSLPKPFSIPEEWKNTTRSDKEQWYRLARLEEADASTKETRFLCQFFTLRPTYDTSTTNPIVKGVEKVIVGETWSIYPYNYEHAHQRHRRGQVPKPMFTRPEHEKDVNGIHNEYVWNAILLFKCPIPAAIFEAKTTADHPSFYLDLVPVRTPPREDVTGYALPILQVSKFNPRLEWGSSHILPPVSQSGRWANIPICPIPMTPARPKPLLPTKENIQKTDMTTKSTKTATVDTNTTKPYFIVGCVWASAVFSERGRKEWDTQTIERMLEWLTYHLELAGFDHMVIYDNTAAHTDEISLKPVLDLFPPHQVTRIPWKHRVCNNNIYEDFNSGERSSQYAAEASCRERYGPMTEWMSFFDTDEYLIPSGNWSSIREWLKVGVETGSIGPDTQILSLYETKASLNYRFMEPFVDDSVKECHSKCTTCDCLKKRKNATYLEAYCEPQPFPRPFPLSKQKMKQLYRPSFVLNHFVHYSAVTNYVHTKPRHPRVVEWPVERRAIEFTEAYMVHTKTKLPAATSGWKATRRCVSPHKCPVGFPFPFYQDFNYTTNTTTPNNETLRWHPQLKKYLINEMGIPYNCYELRKVKEDLGVRLHEILDPRKEKLDEVMANLKFFSTLPGTNKKVI